MVTEEKANMQTESFKQACKKAEEIASFLKNPEYRAAAFHVALERLLSDSGSLGWARSQTQKRATEGKNGNAIRSVTQRRILDLRDGGFFQQPRLSGEVRSELQTQGFHHNLNDVQMALLRLAQKKLFRRVHDKGNKYRYALR